MGALYLKDLADKTRRGLCDRVEDGKSGGGNSYDYDEAILDGRQPPEVNLARLTSTGSIPLSWVEQRSSTGSPDVPGPPLDSQLARQPSRANRAPENSVHN